MLCEKRFLLLFFFCDQRFAVCRLAQLSIKQAGLAQRLDFIRENEKRLWGEGELLKKELSQLLAVCLFFLLCLFQKKAVCIYSLSSSLTLAVQSLFLCLQASAAFADLLCLNLQLMMLPYQIRGRIGNLSLFLLQSGNSNPKRILFQRQLLSGSFRAPQGDRGAGTDLRTLLEAG